MKTKINWLEWGKSAFEKARKEDKPILLDLTAVWCHWCHVMDAGSYSDDDIAEAISKDFVPVKVDIDKRPDIKERYNMGGFPSTVFLNPDGCIIAGETYVPPERLKAMLKSVKEEYKKRKEEIKQKISEAAEKIIKGEYASKAKISEDAVKEILLLVEGSFDSFYGGFGAQPKFPSPDVVDLLFLQYKKTKSKKCLEMAIKTLDEMRNGIYDNVDFGFFRYSVSQDWKIPHYEKMLDTNAGLLRNYADAFDITGDEKYRETAVETISYINKFLSDQNGGGFYGSQDADEEFYHLNADERKRKGYPHVDRTIYVDWNAMMISSYIKTGVVLNDGKITDFAVKTADFILEKCYDKGKGMSHYYDGEPHIRGLLADNIHFLNCLVDIYAINKNQKYLGTMKELAGFILESFYDVKNGGFFDRIIEKGDFGTLNQRSRQFLDNSFCAVVFLRLHSIAKEEEYRQAAEKTLLYFADSYLNFGYFAALYAVGVEMILGNS
ncbi:thioredoxin domain-containing protein [Candidatus Woesearchaeota archaeon]|nr:thioredoxin domain-containing protein [Candidatus Woesearchaeota archaeon]